ncbi:two-component system sensor histidine kinase NtrB [Teredinibacter franksiae]|uniref:two-component system sensor histidine kinase NtrB n=1 Tax=Teredinibacter franksiae TaxID=2761453 RepID=UPI001628B787|nr:ATP-binding protein [Teredinibacter franksiae]
MSISFARLIIAAQIVIAASAAAAPSQANVPLSTPTNNYWLIALFVVIGAQTIGLIWLLINRKKNVDHIDEPAPLLQNTQYQLFREIARHEATEELLRETQEYMHCMVNSMPAVLIGITPNGYVTHWNHSAEKVAGLTSEEAVGSHIDQAFPELPISMEAINDTIRTGIPLNKGTIKDGVGSQATFTSLTIYPLISPDITGAVILAEDVTPKVRMENLLIQNEKMLSLGELAAGVAHEINNPLAGILSNAQNILRRTSPNFPANKLLADELNLSLEALHAYLKQRDVITFIENIQKSGERAADIVKNLLEFSHGNDGTHKPTNLKSLIINTLDLASNTFEVLPEGKAGLPEITVSITDALPAITCSPTEIQQVLLNLLRNAVQAIRTANNKSVPGRIDIHVETNKENAIVSIADNGPGMEEDVLKHIFEPFYTTKGVGQGTGLGLSVSYFIMREHHQGGIEVESEPGKGTRFQIKLPLQTTTNQHTGRSDKPTR